MDRRAKKLEKKRKSRDKAKKATQAAAMRESQQLAQLVRSVSNAEFGPCYVSEGWDDLKSPALVTVVVSRKLDSRHFVPGVALVDRTCLGVKDAFARDPMLGLDLEDFLDEVGSAQELLPCEPLVAQSVVFHAIDYARSLGFEPHRDFPAALFAPRPTELMATPWHAPDRPIYISGPRDDTRAIMSRLENAVGDRGFGRAIPPASFRDDGEYDDEPLIHSSLERTISQGDASVRIQIYRGVNDTGWILELEDELGGSTVWDDQFETDRAALDAALLAVEEDGIESFSVESTGVS